MRVKLYIQYVADLHYADAKPDCQIEKMRIRKPLRKYMIVADPSSLCSFNSVQESTSAVTCRNLFSISRIFLATFAASPRSKFGGFVVLFFA